MENCEVDSNKRIVSHCSLKILEPQNVFTGKSVLHHNWFLMRYSKQQWRRQRWAACSQEIEQGSPVWLVLDYDWKVMAVWATMIVQSMHPPLSLLSMWGAVSEIFMCLIVCFIELKFFLPRLLYVWYDEEVDWWWRGKTFRPLFLWPGSCNNIWRNSQLFQTNIGKLSVWLNDWHDLFVKQVCVHDRCHTSCYIIVFGICLHTNSEWPCMLNHHIIYFFEAVFAKQNVILLWLF